MNSQPPQKTLGFWQFAWQKVKVQVVGIAVSAVVGITILLIWGTEWWNWFEPLLAVLTLGVAAFVWYGQKRAEWEEYLPNRLTVHFYYEGKEVMRCEKAHLTAEGDIRALAQQIGMQMAHNEQLKFVAAQVEVSAPILNQDEHKQEWYLHYTANIYLTELPKALANSADRPRVWREPFMDSGVNEWLSAEPEGARSLPHQGSVLEPHERMKTDAER
ncbi:MAG: hypothetical protein NZT92_10775 [Abditibacteriales bacterium]|nr:hypothetical protein [Abditibacteriales bacterium]